MIPKEELLGSRILVVDDSLVSISLLEDMLRSAGYMSVKSLTDPREVEAELDQFKPALLLFPLTIKLPK